ncbi:MAG: polyphosphate kinase 2 family protein [Flavobacteriales bacterium]|nr:polyphosphate kinase 2 family protein [Flavobacteriia bacterium]NCP05553.1 polyphosphate kinase 2 family protein [Flavobacteriales bacterium]PIV93497.1 MAG: phosphate--nucleotide phosphotransferase [Flavobacteriaceae bacterium CG17_big_fil_post_rev_8_21_14_2_50_33_15]PIY10552.1 MAG: phosphate--nucleotide phosphotransferase [Flavobacteriaceae bacterium CG_4_10_14_3_um_filter_33_47]PJB17966.1 MAG: phosphate--nucleotide phosphotransferase [Flavobacteriaceae bacterium CG_4_9_14_3_um_filter_33_16
MENISINDFKVTSKISLKNSPTKLVIEDAEDEMEDLRKKLGKLQDTMYAHGKYAVLVCLQGMDTSGKDSLIREVFKQFNTRGIVVHSFKVPTELELNHDYLWRHYLALPSRGKFGVFNRTHYENVLVTRVHPGYILGENIPTINSVDDINEAFWDSRFEQINNFEKHIAQNGTIIFKFFLNLSKEEQKYRLLRRLEKQEKNWKFSPGDLKERMLWDKYQECYEDAINKTSKPHAPWYTIPADDKDSARYLVAKIMYDTLKEYDDIQEPELDDAIKANLELYKQQLENEQ